MLDKGIHKYQNRAIEAAQVIEKLIKLAKEMLGAYKRGENLGMSDDEIAFYDALEVSDSAVKVLGDETLKTIARELVKDVLIVFTLYPFICKAKTSGFKLAEHAETAWFPPGRPARLNGAKRPSNAGFNLGLPAWTGPRLTCRSWMHTLLRSISDIWLKTPAPCSVE